MLLSLSTTSHACSNVMTCSNRDADVSPNTCSWGRRHRLHMQNALAGGDENGYIGSARCPLLNTVLLPHALPSHTLSKQNCFWRVTAVQTAFLGVLLFKKRTNHHKTKWRLKISSAISRRFSSGSGAVLARNKELLNVMRQIISCRQIGKQAFLEMYDEMGHPPKEAAFVAEFAWLHR